MAKECADRGVKLMVAYRLHFEEGNLKALDLARSGILGELTLFSSFFTHVVREGDIRRDPEVGGGATYDLGVYCINAARNLFDAEPVCVTAFANQRDGIDETMSAVLEFPYGRLAQFCVSNATSSVSNYRLAGTKGDLRVEPAYEYAGEIVHHLTIGEDTKKTSFKKRDQFAPELEYFSDCILNDLEPEPSAEEGLCDVRVIEAALESARTRRPVELAPYQRGRRPSSSQEAHEPPVSEQKPVNAPSPSLR
jgi:predicted dehydrogenase